MITKPLTHQHFIKFLQDQILTPSNIAAPFLLQNLLALTPSLIFRLLLHAISVSYLYTSMLICPLNLGFPQIITKFLVSNIDFN